MPVEEMRISDSSMDMRKILTDGSLAAGCTILSGDLQQTIGINLEGGNELGLAPEHGWDTSELELSEQTIVAALCALTLVPKIHV